MENALREALTPRTIDTHKITAGEITDCEGLCADKKDSCQKRQARRLIDADALIAECENAICPTASGRMVLRSVIRTIKKTPTAYDPDKVVEQLNEEKEFSYADFDEYVNEVCPCLDAEYDDLFNKGLERAIEIVKGGGVDG